MTTLWRMTSGVRPMSYYIHCTFLIDLDIYTYICIITTLSPSVPYRSTTSTIPSSSSLSFSPFLFSPLQTPHPLPAAYASNRQN